jgi:hypothetical protein
MTRSNTPSVQHVHLDFSISGEASNEPLVRSRHVSAKSGRRRDLIGFAVPTVVGM